MVNHHRKVTAITAPQKAWPGGYKTFSMLNSAEHEIYPAQNVKMPTIVGILTFISMINTTSKILKARNFFICWYFSFYEQLKLHAIKKLLEPRA